MSYTLFMRSVFFSTIGLLLCLPLVTHAQELVTDDISVLRARVIEVVQRTTETVPGTNVEQVYQTIRAEILEGDEKGTTVTVENDHLELREGDTFYLTHTVSMLDGASYYSVAERTRLMPLVILTLLFIGVVALFGGIQGIRGLGALIASFVFIGLFLLPGIVHGYSPVLVSVGVASLIVLIGSYVTHGFTRTTTAAVIGMVGTIALTGFLAYFSIQFTYLTGWSSEEITYLHLNFQGQLDLTGLLLGGILIGLLGVLYDAAIGQAVSVEEIARAGEKLTRKEVYMRVLRIGREHVGALVNTLAIAYAGASLPLLLLFYGAGDMSIGQIVSREFFATEIVRILVGSIGLVLAVPITTAVAVRMLVSNDRT